MKKSIAIIAAMLFVFGFTASAFAAMADIPADTSAAVAKGNTQVTVSGSLRFRGNLQNNTKDFNSDKPDAKGLYDTRIRLAVDAKVAPNAEGYIQLESGTANNKDVYPWGGVNYKPGGITWIRQAWINYKPADMLGVKVGHMPLALGNKIFFNNTKFGDDAIVVYAAPNKNTKIAALTIKFDDAKKSDAQDMDAYVVLGTYKGGAFNVSGDVTYIAANAGQLYGMGGSDNLMNIGVRGSGNVGPVTLRGDIEYQTGKFAKDVVIGGVNYERKVGAYAVVVGADAKLGMATLTVDGGRGTGTKTTALATDKYKTFSTALGAQYNAPLYTFVYDLTVMGATGDKNMGIANTTFVRLAAKAKPMKSLAVKLQLVYLRATEKMKNLRGGTDSSKLGTEFDAKVTYKLAKNLKYYVEGGCLMVGAAYEDAAGNADNPWRVRHGIILSF
ncbi:hypothetical protein BMS3Bbin05_01170 [bacterium BMS3Bbin05]|nr:hypothetical protein BMS3Bbin05_01170 [bacterium BMS3Bbin05]